MSVLSDVKQSVHDVCAFDALCSLMSVLKLMTCAAQMSVLFDVCLSDVSASDSTVHQTAQTSVQHMSVSLTAQTSCLCSMTCLCRHQTALSNSTDIRQHMHQTAQTSDSTCICLSTDIRQFETSTVTAV